MPGRNGTGPMGRGPMTGRGLGMCRGFRNFGRWFGFGLNNLNNIIPQQNELDLLKNEAKATEEELKQIQKRIAELENIQK